MGAGAAVGAVGSASVALWTLFRTRKTVAAQTSVHPEILRASPSRVTPSSGP